MILFAIVINKRRLYNRIVPFNMKQFTGDEKEGIRWKK
jgi:hypothetical protein